MLNNETYYELNVKAFFSFLLPINAEDVIVHLGLLNGLKRLRGPTASVIFFSFQSRAP